MNLFMSRFISLSSFYVAISLPAMLVLSLIISPFGSNDEQEHFVRIVSIINGYIVPEVSYDEYSSRLDKRIAGGHVGAQVIAVEKEIDYGRSAVDPKFKISISKLKLAIRRYDDHELEFSEHSNTALYPPILYTAPIIAIFFAKLLHAPILAWLYAGRIANSFFSCIICWFAIRNSRGVSHILLVLSCLPIVLFQSASLSADALLFPMFLLFCSIIGRIIEPDSDRINDILLATVAVVLSIGKVAYLPVSLVPAVVLWFSQSRSIMIQKRFFYVSILSVVGWLFWAYTIHDKVFSMRPEVIIDPKQQINFVATHPFSVIRTFISTTFDLFPSLVLDAFGRKLGYETVRIPSGICGILFLCVLILGFVKTSNLHYKKSITGIFTIVSFVCFLATLSLLYLQFNPVGAVYLAGIQGRYLTPMLIMSSIFLPTLKSVKEDSIWTNELPMIISVVCAFLIVSTAYTRYWVD